MGKLYDSLLSGTSGRTGRIVVANVYGNEYTKIRPRKRTSPPTAKQKLIQDRMKDCAAFMLSYRSYACNYFGHRIGVKSPYNLAMTNLISHFNIDYLTSAITPYYPGILFSKGSLIAPVADPLGLPKADALQVSWQDNSGGNVLRQADLAQILIAADQELNTLFIENAAKREDMTYTVNLPLHMQGKMLHVWLAFKNEDESNASNSLYLGSIS